MIATTGRCMSADARAEPLIRCSRHHQRPIFDAMSPTQIALLQQLAKNLRKSAESVDRLIESFSTTSPQQATEDSRRIELAGSPHRSTEAALTVEEIEASILKHGSPRKAAEALGVCLPTLNSRLKAAYGPSPGDAAASGALLRRLIVRLGLETVAEEIGTSPAVVTTWARRHRIPGTGRRAIARVADHHGISLSEQDGVSHRPR